LNLIFKLDKEEEEGKCYCLDSDFSSTFDSGENSTKFKISIRILEIKKKSSEILTKIEI
jgi:hypothetical protein